MTNRPDIWLGHASLSTNDLSASGKFFRDIGLRFIFESDSIAIFELRGGTHLILSEEPVRAGNEADFDFMVEDIDTTYVEFTKLGYSMTGLEKGEIHDWFHITEPGGNTIKVNSTHVADHGLV